MKETKKEVIDIIDKMENSKTENIEKIKIQNKMLEVRNNLADFLSSLLKSSMEEDNLLKKAKERILDLIPDLEFKDVLSLITSVERIKANRDENITGLLKPNQQSNSPLLEVFSEIKEKEKDGFAEAFENSDSKELREIDKMDKVLSMITKLAEQNSNQGNNKDESEKS